MGVLNRTVGMLLVNVIVCVKCVFELVVRGCILHTFGMGWHWQC